MALKIQEKGRNIIRASSVTRDTKFIERTQRWIDAVVVGLNLCPFARKEVERESIRFVVADDNDEGEALLAVLRAELNRMERDVAIETTLIIHPFTLLNFLDYNEFLGVAEDLLSELDLEGVIQIASFHPDYQFAHTAYDDPENYSNRSPYPMLHLLRESSVSRAVDQHPDIQSVPENNVSTLRALGVGRLRKLIKEFSDED